MKHKYMHIRPTTVNGATQFGVTVCFTLPEDNLTDALHFAISGTNRRKSFNPRIIQSIVDSLDLSDFTVDRNPKTDAINVLQKHGDVELALKKVLLNRLKSQHHDQFCKKTGRERALENYQNKKLFDTINLQQISTTPQFSNLTDIQHISEIPDNTINQIVRHFASWYAQLNLPMFDHAKFKSVEPQITGLYLPDMLK